MARRIKTKDTTLKHETVSIGDKTYTYRLIITESTRVASYGIPLYSIDIEYTNVDGSSSHTRASEVFADPGKAIDFFEKLVRSHAGPIDLPYVLEREFSRY